MGAILENLKKIKNKILKTHTGHVLTEEDRLKSQEVLQMNKKINMLERQLIQQKRLEKLEDAIINGGNKDSMEAMFISQVLPLLLAGNLSKNAPNAVMTNNKPQELPADSSQDKLSDDEIKNIANMLKPYASKYLNEIRVLSDSEILRIRAELVK